jgi:transcriptional regulator with XRE-family HTH domain
MRLYFHAVSEPSSSTANLELAEFLRTRRARVQPVDVGLVEGSRRRTPGLRREEVARLADVGASWYTWLEQGRPIQVSAPLLERLAAALRLTATERSHLFELAQGRPPARAPLVAAVEVSPALQHVLDAHPFPALASTQLWDVVAWNRAAVRLYGDFGRRPAKERNSLWSTFMSPKTRALIPDWAPHARGLVARFRVEAGRAPDRREFDALAADLSRASPEFKRFWDDHDIFEAVEGLKEVVHPDVGAIAFDHVGLMHVEPGGRTLRVTLYAPRPGVSATRARKLFRAVRA